MSIAGGWIDIKDEKWGIGMGIRNFLKEYPKELIIEAILSGLADPGGSVIAPADKFWHNPAVKSFPEDINKAKKILAEAGYTWKKGKLHYPA